MLLKEETKRGNGGGTTISENRKGKKGKKKKRAAQSNGPHCRPPVPCGSDVPVQSPYLWRAPQVLLCFQSKNRRQFGCENNPLPRDQFSDWPAPTSPRPPCTSTSDLRLDRSPQTSTLPEFLSLSSLCFSARIFCLRPSFALSSESFLELVFHLPRSLTSGIPDAAVVLYVVSAAFWRRVIARDVVCV